MYQVLDKGIAIKTYPTKEQCATWCLEKGYVVSGLSDFGPLKRSDTLIGVVIERVNP